MADTDPKAVASAEKAIEHKTPIVSNLPLRVRLAIVALIVVIVILVAQSINQGQENERLLKAQEKARQEQVLDLSVLLRLVERAEAAAQEAGKAPAVTTEQAIEALRKSGFEEDVIKQAVERAKAAQAPGATGRTGPQGPAGPPGATANAPTTTTATTTSSTTTTTRPPVSPTTTTTTRPPPKPCTVGLNVPGLTKVCL